MGSLAPSEAQKLRLAVNLADEFGAGEVPQQAIDHYDSDYPLVLSSLLDGQTQAFPAGPTAMIWRRCCSCFASSCSRYSLHRMP